METFIISPVCPSICLFICLAIFFLYFLFLDLLITSFLLDAWSFFRTIPTCRSVPSGSAGYSLLSRYFLYVTSPVISCQGWWRAMGLLPNPEFDTLRWFHFVKEETVNVTILQPLYCKICLGSSEFCSTKVGQLSH